MQVSRDRVPSSEIHRTLPKGLMCLDVGGQKEIIVEIQLFDERVDEYCGKEELKIRLRI